MSDRTDTIHCVTCTHGADVRRMLLVNIISSVAATAVMHGTFPINARIGDFVGSQIGLLPPALDINDTMP